MSISLTFSPLILEQFSIGKRPYWYAQQPPCGVQLAGNGSARVETANHGNLSRCRRLPETGAGSPMHRNRDERGSSCRHSQENLVSAAFTTAGLDPI